MEEAKGGLLEIKSLLGLLVGVLTLGVGLYAYNTFLYRPAQAADGNAYVSSVSVTVSPSGDTTGVADADHIQAALKQVASAGGSVFLAEGDFYVSKGIILCDDDVRTTKAPRPPWLHGNQPYQGAPPPSECDLNIGGDVELKGAGMGLTTINAVRGAGGADFDFTYKTPDFNYQDEYMSAFPSVFTFEQAKGIQIKDLSFKASESAYAAEYMDYGMPTTALWAFVNDWRSNGNLIVKNVSMVAGNGDFNLFCGRRCGFTNVMNGIFTDKAIPGSGDFGMPASADIGVTNSEFKGLAAGMFLYTLGEGDAYIVGNTFSSNQHGILLEDMWGSNTLVSRNLFSDSKAQDMWLYLVRGNQTVVSSNDFDAGLRMWDDSILFESANGAEVFDNTFTSGTEYGAWSAIWMTGGSRNNVIRNNVFDYDAAVAELITINARDNLLTGNDYTQSDLRGWGPGASSGDCDGPWSGGPGVAWLHYRSSNNSVIETALPEGTTLDEMVCDWSGSTEVSEDDIPQKAFEKPVRVKSPTL